jgi:hypothetical protein
VAENKIIITLEAADKTGPAIDKAINTAEKKFDKASQRRASVSSPVDTGTQYGPAIKSRFDAQEQMVRDQVAGRIRAMRDQARRAQIAEAVERRLYGDPAKETLKPPEAAGVAERVAASKKRDKDAEKLTPIQQIKKAFGEESQFGGLAKIVAGGGAIAGIAVAADAAARLAGSITKARSETALMKRDSGEVAEEFAQSIPVLGRIREAGLGIRDIFTGEQFREGLTRELSAMQDDTTARVGELSKIWKRWETDAVKAAMAVRAAAAGAADPNNAGLYARNAGVQSREMDLRRQAAEEIDAARKANEEKLGELKAQRGRLTGEQDPSALARPLSFLANNSAIVQRLAPGAGKVELSTEQQQVLAQVNADIARLEAAQSKLVGKVGGSRDRQIQAERDRAYLEQRKELTDQMDPTGMEERARQLREADANRRRSLGAAGVTSDLRVAGLRRTNRGDEADAEEIKARAEQARQQRLADDAKAFDEGQLSSRNSIQEAQRLSAELLDIERRKNSQLEDLRQARIQKEADQTRQHDESLAQSTAQAAGIRLQAAGRGLEAEKLQLKEQLRQKLEQIRAAAEDELRANGGDPAKRAAIEKRAREEAEAARGIYEANADALASRRGGVGINFGSAGGQSRLGGRLTQQEVQGPLASGVAKAGDKTEKAIKESARKFEEAIKGLPQLFGTQLRTELRAIFAT